MREPQPQLNGSVEENVTALIRTIYGDPREPGSGLVARMVRMETLLQRIYTAVIGILSTGFVALVVNVVVLLGK